jgi:virulence-associated protein VapD
MPRYAISFDLDRKALVADGYTDSQINNDIYTKEVQAALNACGFTEHPEGSVYHTGTLSEDDSLTPVVNLQRSLQTLAPTFCKYIRSIHLFKMEGWSNITTHIQHAGLSGVIAPKGRDSSSPVQLETDSSAA